MFGYPINDAYAVKSKDQVCKSIARKAKRTLWNSVREAGDNLFCRKGWLTSRVDELTGCGGWTKINRFGNLAKNKLNRFFDKANAEWATWGPRGISADWENGTIRGGYKRTFFGPALAYNKSVVEVVKIDGRSSATVTVCKLNYKGNVVKSYRKTFPKGKSTGKVARKFTIKNRDTYILGVVVDAPAGIKRFKYRARVKHFATRNKLGPVKGIADLHVHQFANISFGGRFYWGHYRGNAKEALHKEVITGVIGAKKIRLDQVLAQISAFAGKKIKIDANIFLKATMLKASDEGEFFIDRKGGYPNYRSWPRHYDRSHQQAHIDWVKEAHLRGKRAGRNLNLMIASLVNNDVLCTVLTKIDPYGNVPRWKNGKIKGWESANWGCSDHENVMRQLKAIHQLERDYPWYRVAMTPWHARQIIADGDLAVVVSLETDKPLSSEGGNYGNWRRQLDAYRAMGVTTMQIVHESNSIFSGAAPHRFPMKVLQAIHFPIKSLGNLVRSKSTFHLDSNGYNRLGLTKEGRKLVDALVKRNLPIDLAHSSIQARKQIMSRIPKGYGIYDSHTKFERLLTPHVLKREKKFLITKGILPLYVRHKVVVGLRPTSIDVNDAPKVRGVTNVENTCPGSATSFAQYIQYATSKRLSFAYGSDFNTGVAQLGPRFGKGICYATRQDSGFKKKARTERSVEKEDLPQSNYYKNIKKIAGTNYYVDGVTNIGWLPELTRDLIALGTHGARKLTDGAEAYISMWERSYNTDKK